MNISKKALMSVIMALTSLIAMAQPYYHIMKQDDGKLTEEAMYDGQTYKVKIDMEKPVEKPVEKPEDVKPECAIGNKITIPSCGLPYKSFYFTNKGNIYYDASKRKLFFEETQLDYPKIYSENHRGHFRWGKSLSECLGNGSSYYSESNPPRNSDFYFAKHPQNHPKNYCLHRILPRISGLSAMNLSSFSRLNFQHCPTLYCMASFFRTPLLIMENAIVLPHPR